MTVLLIVATVFSLWLALTVLNQADRTRRPIRSIVGYDILGLVPIWTFFAPNPGDTDLHLLYRDLDRHGNVGPWHEVVIERRRHVLHLWLPHRRVSKALSDVAHDLTRFDWDSRATEHGHTVHPSRVLSFPYLYALNLVTSEPALPETTHRQFAVARTRGPAAFGEPDIYLLSAFHEQDEP
ncbi:MULTISPECIES: hypothetical protein [Streptomyces]|uniref:Uncharacterized protein n=1 Tax=Streptomyces dengpaensis TaxID=2049881 RepID=A0ABM6SMG8_9ACTN|nr:MULTISPECIES: hypothetical protein [Streptomyces]AVH55862.1 hypothetical protein C4B68_08860 [Streptomyces dengpaensis]PIB12113.1 hypothetical protein B1C81_02795 [Streptomyces sp. HG99]